MASPSAQTVCPKEEPPVTPVPLVLEEESRLGSDIRTVAAGQCKACIQCGKEQTPQWRTGPFGGYSNNQSIDTFSFSL